MYSVKNKLFHILKLQVRLVFDGAGLLRQCCTNLSGAIVLHTSIWSCNILIGSLYVTTIPANSGHTGKSEDEMEVMYV